VKKGQPPPQIDPQAEVEKLDKILRLVREPDYKEKRNLVYKFRTKSWNLCMKRLKFSLFM